MARILLIDDDPSFRKLVARMLLNAGHEAVEAGNGREGIQALSRGPIDLVVTDLIMPDMEGVETLQYLRRSHPGLKVIVMTGGGRVAPESYLKLALGFGAFRALTKPFSTDEFLKAVEAALESRGVDPKP